MDVSWDGPDCPWGNLGQPGAEVATPGTAGKAGLSTTTILHGTIGCDADRAYYAKLSVCPWSEFVRSS